MKKCFIATACLLSAISLSAQPLLKPNTKAPKIQAAILLDVSNSMDGLINQAKTQLWNMVSVMGKAECNGLNPSIEIALYEYGRSTNNVKEGYVKQISAFTTDLDELSKKLFALTTNGGDEYCGQVIYTSVDELKWDTSASSYKTIFIAGNEDFLQGQLQFTVACAAAKKKDIIVNTLYCGDKQQGIAEHWNLGSECGNGSFTNINQNEKVEEIPTPYDQMLFSLNDSLNKTYVYYGVAGASKFADQAGVDAMNMSSNKSAAAKRVSVKAQKSVYKNETWDLVDAEEKNPGTITKVDKKTLPKELQNKSRQELDTIIKAKMKSREAISKQIELLSKKRQDFIAADKLKNSTAKPTLESEIEKIIRLQAKRFKMTIK